MKGQNEVHIDLRAETNAMTPTPDLSAAELRLEKMEEDAVNLVRQACRLLGSNDANDSGPAICAIWNLGSEARRFARIAHQALGRLQKIG